MIQILLAIINYKSSTFVVHINIIKGYTCTIKTSHASIANYKNK